MSNTDVVEVLKEEVPVVEVVISDDPTVVEVVTISSVVEVSPLNITDVVEVLNEKVPAIEVVTTNDLTAVEVFTTDVDVIEVVQLIAKDGTDGTDGLDSIVPGPPGVATVVHGSDPKVQRPDTVLVFWYGSVEPNNWTSTDIWVEDS